MAAKFIALLSVFTLLSLVVANASIHRTIVTTEIDEVENPRQQTQKCEEQIQRKDLSHCEDFITQSRGGYNPEHRQQCCQQLREVDEECRCEALNQIVRQQRQQGQMEGEEMREMLKRAKSIPSYCRIEGCQMSRSEIEDEIVNPQRDDCRRQVQKQDFSRCERFITSRRSRIEMFTSNPEQSVQGCCQQLRKVDEQCRCEALKQIVREQQQEGQFQGQEMQEVMQRAQSIPRMCNMEPRRCEWRLVLV